MTYIIIDLNIINFSTNGISIDHTTVIEEKMTKKQFLQKGLILWPKICNNIVYWCDIKNNPVEDHEFSNIDQMHTTLLNNNI